VKLHIRASEFDSAAGTVPVTLSGHCPASDALTVLVDGNPVAVTRNGDVWEVTLNLAQGTHTLTVKCGKGVTESEIKVS
jgi:hypothetical protein